MALSGLFTALAENGPRLPPIQIGQTVSDPLARTFSLSWSQYIFLLQITKSAERRFYELEAASESDLERAIIDRLERFLLELGKGFLFEARQKRLTLKEDHYFVDLVFYNRLLKAYVLFDLKIGKLTHQDIGQMQMYTGYFDRYVKTKSENPTIGVLLCKTKDDAMVRLTVPHGNKTIFASRYQLYLPSKAELRSQLQDRVATNVTSNSRG